MSIYTASLFFLSENIFWFTFKLIYLFFLARFLKAQTKNEKLAWFIYLPTYLEFDSFIFLILQLQSTGILCGLLSRAQPRCVPSQAPQ